ncbi:hypothetical protein Tcan_06037 [Toxocara canis]|uniref:Uncharacterized protein n=1 Tax=Toxocara canis TaxID=6265 RepID=A0A0B2V607_TOXCA|nr:hypothetical protein Tcan_06037 [Toxocara canis]
MFILRHFFVIYSRVTFVNPLSYGQYLLKDKSLGSKTSTTSGTSKNSRKSLRERSISGLPPSEHKFSLLEDAVHAWRSETVLSKVELVDGMEVTRRFELDRVSVKSDSRQRKVSQPVNDRASFTSTNEATQRRACFFATHHNRNLIDPSQSPSVRKISVFNSPPVNFQISSFECSACTPTATERRSTIGSVNSCCTSNGSSTKKVPFARKISEVLLGKATRDIRRRSTYGMPSERLTRFKAARNRFSERRRSLFSSLKWKSMRNRQRRKKKMEIVKEIEETREINTDCENTYSQRPLLLSVALQKNQVSLDSQDSYATAHELVSISDTLDL